jgi:hypothetical protein
MKTIINRKKDMGGEGLGGLFSVSLSCQRQQSIKRPL